MKKIVSILLAIATLANISCSNEQTEREHDFPSCTYLLHLSVDVADFESAQTRAMYVWEDNACIYLQFHVNGNSIIGLAKYSQTTDEWSITTNQNLPTDIDGDCEAYYFVNPTTTTSQSITLGVHTTVYQDTEGSFVLADDNVLSVRLLLTPRTGRVRFKGKPSTAFAITGLTYNTNYDIQTNTFTTTNNKLSGTFDGEGDTDYYYATFTDTEKRQLMMDGTGKGAYLREFDESVLATGQSGYITLPSVENIGNWTLVNADNLQEITLPVVSATEVSNLRSKFATLKAMVENVGNGTLSETGFIYSTNSSPTIENGTKVAVGKSTQIETRISDLSAETTYNVVAYAQNEKGIAYGKVTSFTTLSTEDDGTLFGREEYGDDEDLNSDGSTNGTITKDGYHDDEDLNQSSASNGTFSRNGYGNDDNLNGSSSNSGNMSKSGYDNDINWN